MAFQAGASADEFWVMTPQEFQALLRAYGKKEEIQNNRAAWVAANIMNCWTKKKITPDQLLGKKKPNLIFTSKEELRAYMNAKVARQRAKDGY